MLEAVVGFVAAIFFFVLLPLGVGRVVAPDDDNPWGVGMTVIYGTALVLFFLYAVSSLIGAFILEALRAL